MDTSISRRLTALEAALSSTKIPSFSEFVKMWEDADELSKSLFETALACPSLMGEHGRRWDVISGYLQRLNITPEPFDLKELVENLRSDDI